MLAIALVVVAIGTFSIISVMRRRTIFTMMELVGTGCLIVVVMAHVFERFRLFPLMGWGLPNSAGHYLDVMSAIAGLILFPIGLLSDRIQVGAGGLVNGKRSS